MYLKSLAASVIAMAVSQACLAQSESFISMARAATWYGDVTTTVVNLRSGRPAPNRLDYSSVMYNSDGGGVAGSENYDGWAAPGVSVFGMYQGMQVLPGGGNFGIHMNEIVDSLLLKPHSSVTFSFDAGAAAQGNATGVVGFEAYMNPRNGGDWQVFTAKSVIARGLITNNSMVCSRGRVSMTISNLSQSVVEVGYNLRNSWGGGVPMSQ